MSARRLLAATVLLVAFVAWAHTPGHLYADRPYVVDRPEISKAYFGQF